MVQLIECVPNFSEGRDSKFLKEILELAQGASGVTVLGQSKDKDHNRSSITLLGAPEKVFDAVYQLSEYAIQQINMNNHFGEHPRMGAVDVVPFVPLKNISIDETVSLSKRFGEKLNNDFDVPVFLYEESASSEERRNLANIRRGEFEAMSDKLKEEGWAPDFGEAVIHPTAGVTAVGARLPLVAFNVNLATSNIDVAQQIAKTIRYSNGGYKHLKAIAIRLEAQGIVQVSMNITNYEELPLYRVLETIRFEAKRYGVSIQKAEIYGMTPAKALVDSAAYYLQLDDFNSHAQILENYYE